MGAEIEVRDNRNTRDWLLKGGKRRSLDVFYTDYDTKLYVEDGVLVEECQESVKRPLSDDTYFSDDDFPAGFCSCDTPPQLPYIYEDADDGSQNVKIAEAALEYCNKKQRTSYKLVNPISTNDSILDGEFWLHTNFTAKLSSESSPEKLFFSELKISRRTSNYVVSTCRILPDGKTTTLCGMCRDVILHPTQHFRTKMYDFKDRQLRPRRDGKVVSKNIQ